MIDKRILNYPASYHYLEDCIILDKLFFFLSCLHFLSQSLEFFLKYERVSTPFDLNNDTIDNNLAKTLTRLCGPEKKLAVSSAERNKGIIKEKLVSTTL
jgi:hypothetical protein